MFPDPALHRARLVRAIGLLDAPPDEFADLCRAARARFGVAAAQITLIGPDGPVAAARDGRDLGPALALRRLCERATESGETLVVRDGAPPLRFYAGAPIHYVRGVRLGTLCLADARARDFGPDDVASLERMADAVATAVMDRDFARLAAPVP